MLFHFSFFIFHFSFLISPATAQSIPDEFKIDRQEVFEFTEKPTVSREGEKVTITFASKGFCDATVAIENASGRIVRHLASGVLGPNAPAPFAKNSLRQSVVWDGKDDQGRYVDNPADCAVRVSLGLRARFERTLYWSPKKRIAPGHPPMVAAAPEGVYVFEGGGVDHLRRFDHDGNYLQTLHPFRSDRLERVNGLTWAVFPQSGARLPLKHGLVQATLLTSGDNLSDNTLAKYGSAASAMAVHDGRIALVKKSLNRLATDGTTGESALAGPTTEIAVTARDQGGQPIVYPRSAAFSPDGKYLYLTGYGWNRGYPTGRDWLHAVTRMEFAGEEPPKLFLGSLKERDFGEQPGQFNVPTAVACDPAGRVYVADYMNDRVQVFDADARHLKSIPVDKPASIAVDPKTGEIHVFSWMLTNQSFRDHRVSIEPRYTHLGPLDDPAVRGSYPLPLFGHHPGVSFNRTGGLQHAAYLDPYTSPPTVWVVPGTASTAEQLMLLRQHDYGPWSDAHIRLLRVRDGKLVEAGNFGADVVRDVVRAAPPSPPAADRQRLYVDPTRGMLYVAEGDSGVGKAFKELLRIDPDSGAVRRVPLPFSTEEIAFDLNGHIYLRTDTLVSRFDPANWREVPFDYGEERLKPGFDGDGAPLVSVIALPGSGRPGCFHLGGFAVGPTGNLAVSCYNVKPLEIRIPGAFTGKWAAGRPYQPPLYPGRLRWAEVHVWDRHGQPLYKDAVPGLPMTDGLAIDRDDNLYAMAAANRVLDGQEYFLERGETLMKFAPGKGKLLSARSGESVPIPLGEEAPSRPPDLARGFLGRGWVEGAEWLYGGVGFGGFNSSKGGGGCACWNARFALDLYARSFAPEVDHYSVAVLDSSGNLLMRIGRYGNVDEGQPLVPAGGPAKTQAIGGDEVALFNASYLGVHGDRRLFIADYGNYRLLSVKLDYHAEQRAALKD